MSDCNCKWSEVKSDPKVHAQQMLRLPQFERIEDPWVLVNEKPGTFGHLVVVTGKCLDCADLSSKKWQEDDNLQYLKRTLDLINRLCSCMVGQLKSPDNKTCKKVYVVSQCETQGFHLHFHLYPRFECEDTGNIFLFEKELEEARWVKEGESMDNNVLDGCCRVAKTRKIYEFHKLLISTNRWARNNEKRKAYVKKTKEKIEKILTSSHMFRKSHAF